MSLLLRPWWPATGHPRGLDITSLLGLARETRSECPIPSEIVGLELNADWVILSACNTAGPDGTPAAAGLSGLASAFFYAGARTLLVSHWDVFSEPAAALTTQMLHESKNGKVSRAEALKRSMQALRETPGKPHYAHPLFWAPFVVVGR